MDDHTPATVGVDISKAHLDVHRRPTGESARFANDADGFEELAAWVGDPAVPVVYESTGPWHRNLEETLAGRLAPARVNPLRTRRFAQAMGEEAKTDAADARALAAMGAAMEVRRVEPRPQSRRDLDEPATARDALVKDRTAALNREKHARHPLLRRRPENRPAQIGRRIKALDDRTAKTTAGDAGLSRRMEVLTSIAGVGRVVAAGLLADMPELGRVDGKAAASRHYVFLTTNFRLSAKTVADIYRSRWQVELFFKWIKQHLKVKSFVGTSRNAVMTQLWIAMCVHLLLSHIKFANRLAWSLNEILRVLQLNLFDRRPMLDVLEPTSDPPTGPPEQLQLNFG